MAEAQSSTIEADGVTRLALPIGVHGIDTVNV
jgi:hypothetical protein